jgi:hypothetical protein
VLKASCLAKTFRAIEEQLQKQAAAKPRRKKKGT